MYSRKPTFVGLNLFVWVALQRVSECLTSVSKCHELKETVACLELSRVLFISINVLFVVVARSRTQVNMGISIQGSDLITIS